MATNNCDKCIFNTYDEMTGEQYCDCGMDEDELIRFMTARRDKAMACPYFRDGDEYGIVRHQM